MRVLSTLALILSAGALKLPSNKTQHVALPASSNSTAHHAHTATQADVDQLHKKLETLAEALQSTVDTKLGQTKIGPELKTFVSELKHVLAETKSIKDPAEAFKRLDDARAGMAALTGELTSRQEALMKEDEAQRESLLLGVLMTRQKEPLEEQFKVLQSADFLDLPVSKELLAKHNNQTALYVQVAGYLDAHKGAAATNFLVGNATEHNKAIAQIDALAKSFEARVTSLEKAQVAATKRHEQRMEFLKKGAEKAPKSAKAMKAMMKREERSFKKWSLTQERDIQSMKEAVKAIKSHDMKALQKAKKALEDSVRSMQSKNNGFLVLLDLGHKFLERDCPYCVAQCVDKCHQDGKPYVTCLTDCADAGK